MPITFTDLDLILIVVSLGATFGLTIFFCYFLIPLENRIKFANKLTRKNLGIVEVAGKGHELDTYVVNYDKRIGETKHKVFLLDPEEVYRKNGIKYIHFNELDALDPVMFRGKPLPRGKIDEALRSAGVVDQNIIDRMKAMAEPKTTKDKNGTVSTKYYLFPVSYKKLKPKEQYKNPEMIKGVFMEQKALAEAKALLGDKMFKYLLIGACVMAGLSFVSAFMLNDKIDNQILPKLNGLATTVTDTQTSIGDLSSAVGNMTQPTLYPNGYPSGFVLPNGTVIK